MSSRFKQIEDFMCDELDAFFNDSIKMQKEFDASRECRSISLGRVGNPADDQHTMAKVILNFTSLRKKRSDALEEMDNLYKNFQIYNKNVTDGLVISAILVYITTPVRTIIDSNYGWTYTATFEVTAT